MKLRQLILIVLLFASTSLSCSNIGAQTAEGNILFSDDFSDNSKKWDQVNDTARSTDYFNGAYRITVNELSIDVWAIPWKQSFTDAHLEVDATKNGGPDDNIFGVICRYIDADQFYYGVISSDGFYGIMKMTADDGLLLGRKNMAESSVIDRGSASNHIRFDCVGSNLTLHVNGTQVDQQTDTEYTAGNVGVLAGSFKEAGTDILFDNFFVYTP